MSRRGARRLLWIAALLTVPVPFYLGQPETAPVLRLAFLTGLLCSVAVAEGGRVLLTLCGLGFVQLLAWTALLRVGAGLVVRVSPDAARTPVALALVVGLCVVSTFEIYETALSSTRLYSSVWHLFE